MTITLYTLMYNEEQILPYFLKHYSKYVNKIVVRNNQSTDNSIQILKNWKDCEIEIIDFTTDNHYDERALTDFRNNCWKDGDNSDYVIVCDMDELLYHPDLISYLKKNNDVDYFTPIGYDMIGNEIPTDYDKQIYEIIKTGVPNPNYNKSILFKRNTIMDTGYGVGAHTSNFIGVNDLNKMNYNNDLKLLHYKWLSSDYVINKHTLYGNRRCEDSIKNKWGVHYTYNTETIINSYNYMKNISKVIVNNDFKSLI